jgi:DNA adenine methylase
MVKPIIKWVGGKSQIIDKILSDFPTEMNSYREIFLGGGSVLLAFLSKLKDGVVNIKNGVYAFDINEPLIHMYKNIQTHRNELYDSIMELVDEFNNCQYGCTVNRKPSTIDEALQCKENYYYWIRSQYNNLTDKTSVSSSAMFIFLNKTCFRGVFRIGPNGFNVPYGHYKNPEIINKEHLDEISVLIQPVIFECCDFSKSLSKVESNDFVYLDPPYAPINSTSFVGYTENGFNFEQHEKLFRLVHDISNTASVMMSNADVTLVRDNFRDYNIVSIICKRSINSKNPESKVREVIIKNY